jgi:hypothetical protein
MKDGIDDLTKILRKLNILGRKIDEVEKQISILQMGSMSLESKITKISDKLEIETTEVPEKPTEGEFSENDSNEVLDEFLNQPQGIQSIRTK